MKLGCCCCAGATPAWPYDVEPPLLLPPLLLDGEAHGSLGVGIAVLDGSAVELAVGVGESSPAPRWSDPGVGLRLSSGTGSDVDDGDAVLDAEPDGAGVALDCAAHSALSTGLGEADPLEDGVGEAELSGGAAEGLSEGRSDGLGPPPSANAVAAIDANTATVAAPRAADLRVIDPPPTLLTSPRRPAEKRAIVLKPDVHCP